MITEPAKNTCASSVRRVTAFEIIAVASVVALAAALRLYGLRSLGISSLQPDEARLALAAATIVKYKMLIFNYFSAQEPPLAHYYPIVPMLLFGPKAWAIKLAPIAFNIAAVIFIYLAGRMYISRVAGIAAAAFAAVLPQYVYWSGTAVENIYTAMYCAVMLYGHAGFIRTKRPGYMYAAALAAGLGVSTNSVMYYITTAFVAAVFISGLYKDYFQRARVLIKAVLFFLLGAAPLIAYVIISHKPVDFILYRLGAEATPRTLAMLGAAATQRGAITLEFFSPLIVVPFVVLPLYMAFRKKIDRDAVFLLVFFLAYAAQSVYTWSGPFSEHTVVIVPIAALLIGALADVPAKLMKFLRLEIALAVMLAAAIFTQTAISGHFMPLPAMRGNPAADRKFAAMLSSVDPRKTSAGDKDIIMLQWLQWYADRGALPEAKTAGITSLQCNRFRACSFSKDIVSLDSSMDIFKIVRHENLSCGEVSRINFEFGPECRNRLKELILLLAGNGYENMFICSGPAISDVRRAYTGVVQRMAADGELAITTRSTTATHINCDLFTIRDTGKMQPGIKSWPAFEMEN